MKITKRRQKVGYIIFNLLLLLIVLGIFSKWYKHYKWEQYKESIRLEKLAYPDRHFQPLKEINFEFREEKEKLIEQPKTEPQ